MTGSTDRTLQVSDDVVFRELDGEAVILNLSSGTYFGLDRIGTRAWRLIEAHGSLDRVVQQLVEEYDVSADTLRADLSALFDALVAKGLLVWR
jgi:hypothetical protein